MLTVLEKRKRGEYFTSSNPFKLLAFKEWVRESGIENKTILEPFAGSNNIVNFLKEEGVGSGYTSFDIHPKSPDVRKRDTIENFPTGYDVAITNPPWLATHSASKRGIQLDSIFTDQYQDCLFQMLQYCKYVAAILPATFIQSNLFFRRLHSVVLLTDSRYFLDTEHPSCLAMFSPGTSSPKVWSLDKEIGYIDDLEVSLPPPSTFFKFRFNDVRGGIGFISFDPTRKNGIRFCPSGQIPVEKIYESSRMKTRICIEREIDPENDYGNDAEKMTEELINSLNSKIETFRRDTEDVFLTPFMGMRQDQKGFRRRMTYSMAADFLADAMRDMGISKTQNLLDKQGTFNF